MAPFPTPHVNRVQPRGRDQPAERASVHLKFRGGLCLGEEHLDPSYHFRLKRAEFDGIFSRSTK
jgi:hypothetical protein